MQIPYRLIVALFLSVLIGSCEGKGQEKSAAATQKKITLLSPSQFKEQSKNQIIVDIRTPQEFKEGHLENAINLNFFDPTFLTEIEKFDKNKPLYIYCRSGNRSSKVSPKIIKLGFQQVCDLQGGIKNWNKSKYPLIK